MAKHAFKFNRMDLAELVQLRDEIETALNGKIAMERQELQSKIADLATIERRREKSGRIISSKNTKRDKTNGGAKPHALKGRKAEPKYRGPDGEEWAGRGLTPKWLVALEKKGKKREQFLIKRQD